MLNSFNYLLLLGFNLADIIIVIFVMVALIVFVGVARAALAFWTLFFFLVILSL